MMTTKSRAKKKRLRLERPIKQYALNQCGLYGLKGINQLISVLRWTEDRAKLELLPIQRGSYSTWDEGGRDIQAASPRLKFVQARIAVLLRRVIPPRYRYSGIRGKSCTENAQQHLAHQPSIKIDLKKFYPSTTFNHVRRFFGGQMKCSGDVAYLLANLCCYQKAHLPTGSVHSEVLAFYCHKREFDQLFARALLQNGVMTTYIDDMMYTSPNASRSDLEWARRLFRRAGATVHPAKSRVMRHDSEKTITGVIIKNGQMFAPNGQHLAVRSAYQSLAALSGSPEEPRQVRKLLGHLDHIAHIDSRYIARARGTRAQLKALVGKELTTQRMRFKGSEILNSV